MKKFKHIVGVIRKWNELLDRRMKYWSIGVFFVIVLAAFLETLGVSIIVPFVTALLDAEMLMENEYIQVFANIFNISQAQDLILLLGIGVIVIYILKNAALSLADYVSLRYENQVQKDFAIRMLSSYIRRPYEDSVNINSAEVQRGISNDVAGLYYILQSMFKILANILTIFLIFCFMVYTDAFLAFSCIIFIGITSLFIMLPMNILMKKSGREFNKALLDATKNASQALGGLKEITILRRQKEFMGLYEQAVEKQRRSQLSYRYLQGLPNRIMETIITIGVIIIVYFRFRMGLDTEAFIPQLSAFAIAAIRIMPYVSGIISYLNTMLYYLPSFDNSYENIMKAKGYENYRHSICENTTDINFSTCITLDKVSWRYRDSENNVLDSLSLSIKKGEAIGIIGESGSGKSTLVDIILGLYIPQKGRIEVDGIDIFTTPEQWSKIVGYVPQSVYLLDDTIRNNILFGVSKCDDKKIWRVLEMANLKEFVSSLPEGLDTIVGERGVKFSGGQRQRVAIARALYYNPEILILDEATSALDNQTESAVMEAIECLQGEKTLIIVAHRLTTLKKCDKIYEIKNGRAYLQNKV